MGSGVQRARCGVMGRGWMRKVSTRFGRGAGGIGRGTRVVAWWGGGWLRRGSVRFDLRTHLDGTLLLRLVHVNEQLEVPAAGIPALGRDTRRANSQPTVQLAARSGFQAAMA